MKEQTIRRQHDQTSIPELYGTCCSGFSAVMREPDRRYGPVYLKLSGSWHRFYLDAGLLFWQEGPQPDPDNELLDGEKYVDLAVRLGVMGIPISRIEMESSCLTLEFVNEARLVLRNCVEDDGAELVEFRGGKSVSSRRTLDPDTADSEMPPDAS